MANKMTNDQVEREIARLQASPYVKLAMREKEVRAMRRQMMYELRALEKKGRELEAEGFTMDILQEMTGFPHCEY